MSGEFRSYVPDSEQDEKESKIVGQGEVVVLEPGEVGETEGLGPCFGVIIYNSELKKAFVGHFVDPEIMDHQEFEEMLGDAAVLFKDNMQLTQVYVGGGGVSSIKTKTADLKKRAYVEEKIKQNGLAITKIRYNKPGESTIMKIDTTSGAVDFDVEHDDDE